MNNLNTFTKDLREGALEMKMLILQFWGFTFIRPFLSPHILKIYTQLHTVIIIVIIIMGPACSHWWIRAPTETLAVLLFATMIEKS